jgi:broad specificity phosphatase PhoE
MSESTAPSSSTPCSLASSLTGVGLFLLTTVLSQWIQASKRTEREADFTSRQDSSSSHGDDKNFRQLYQNRRLSDRLSYENLSESFSIPAAASHDEFQYPQRQYSQTANSSMSGPSPLECDNLSSGNDLTEWNMMQQQRRASAAALQKSRQQHQQSNNLKTFPSKDEQGWRSEVHPNAQHDFHPKNRNWRHFEHYNDDDRRRREEKLMREQAWRLNGGTENRKVAAPEQPCAAVSPPSEKLPLKDSAKPATNPGRNARINQFQCRRSASSDISGSTAISDTPLTDEDDDNDAQSISSSSISEEEHFVWTEHRHNSTSGRSALDPPQVWRRNSVHIDDTSTSKHPVVEGKPDSTRQSQRTINNNSLPSRPVQAFRRFLSLDAAHEEAEKDRGTSETSCLMNPRIRNKTLEIHNRRIRAEYNARIMPEKLVLIRHGQSMGNVNEVLYSTTPDNAMPLTRLGWEQARKAGTILKDKILSSGESLHFIVSPYVRTVETFHGIVSAWCDPMSPEFASISDHDEKVKAWYGRLMQMGLTWNEDSRLREQDFGNYQNPEVIKRAKEERHRFGAFYYRFPHGESASDVFDRVSTFLDSLWRSFEMNTSRNYVLVTHGIVLRVLLARYFRYTIDQFNILANPRNCEMVVLGHSGNGKLELEGRCDLDIEINSETTEPRVTGYKFHKRLRILPKSAIRKVKIRISPND